MEIGGYGFVDVKQQRHYFGFVRAQGLLGKAEAFGFFHVLSGQTRSDAGNRLHGHSMAGVVFHEE